MKPREIIFAAVVVFGVGAGAEIELEETTVEKGIQKYDRRRYERRRNRKAKVIGATVLLLA